MKLISISLLFLLFFTGCEKPRDPIQDLLTVEETPPPVLSGLRYYQSAVEKTLIAPFNQSLNLLVDKGSAPCSSSEAKFIFSGDFDADKISSVESIGLAKSVNLNSHGIFNITGCLPQGAAFVQFRGITKAGKKTKPVAVSINLMIDITILTLGYGHPAYPNPGFRNPSSATLVSLIDQNYQMAAVAIEDRKSQIIPSVENSEIVLFTGFLNVIEAQR